MHFLAEYGLFLAKVITFVLAILLVVSFIIAFATRGKDAKEKLKIKKINQKYEDYKNALEEEILTKSELKKSLKAQKKEHKKIASEQVRKKAFVLNFQGDIRASATHSLAEEITALLTIASPQDEVILRLESAGGMVPHYGLAASQLQRLREKNIPLTIIIDKIAASGGYMMACVANKIYAAPFAIIGSIGVIAQLPNFNRFLKNKDIDFEQITAGKYKRTLTVFGENSEEGRLKLQEEINSIHTLFKQFITMHRPQVNIDKVATGEYWHGAEAQDRLLVDDITTSDDYLLKLSKETDLYEVHYSCKKPLLSKLSRGVQNSLQSFLSLHKSHTLLM